MDPQTLQATANSIVSHLKLNNKIVLMKTPCIWAIEHGTVKVKITLKLHHNLLALTMAEGTTYATRNKIIYDS